MDIFIIIAVIFKSISLPIILVLSIEAAIFANLGIPYYTGTVEPFVACIDCVGDNTARVYGRLCYITDFKI